MYGYEQHEIIPTKYFTTHIQWIKENEENSLLSLTDQQKV